MTGACSQLIAPARSVVVGRRRLVYVAAAVLFSVLVLWAAGASAMPGKVKQLQLTGVVTKALKGPGGSGDFTLKSGKKTVGKVTKFRCTGAGFSTICDASMRLKGFGSNLRLFAVTYTCHLKHGGGIKCGAGKGGVEKANGSGLGTIKIQGFPNKIGARFPVTMRLH